MRVHLTDLGLRKLAQPASGQVTYWDASTPGFGVRCSANCKSYVVMYGQMRKLKTFGRYPVLPLADARRQARRFLSNFTDGVVEVQEYEYSEVMAEYLADCEQRLRPSTLYHSAFFRERSPSAALSASWGRVRL